jgi:hypothetical protein
MDLKVKTRSIVSSKPRDAKESLRLSLLNRLDVKESLRLRRRILLTGPVSARA